MAVTISYPTGGSVAVDKYPSQCPICHKSIMPSVVTSRAGGKRYEARVEVVFLCPDHDCDELFVGYYRPGSGTNANANMLFATRPAELNILTTFSSFVESISASFCLIYRQADKAEQHGLSEICGVGYRKALEFLIKDYAIKNYPNEEVKIKSMLLGLCIETYVTDARIKAVAKRATWLGNDETHYQRRFVDKDVNDLKSLIQLTLHWVEMEHLSEQALISMP